MVGVPSARAPPPRARPDLSRVPSPFLDFWLIELDVVAGGIEVSAAT